MSDGYFRCSNGCQCADCRRKGELEVGRMYAEDARERRKNLDTVTAERDTAKEIIKELMTQYEEFAERFALPYIPEDLEARAKELLK